LAKVLIIKFDNGEERTSEMKFDNVAFTKHALERLELRRISREMVMQTIRNPNRQFVEANGNIKFIRKVSGCKVHAICKPLPEESKWLVVSVWVRGEDNHGNQTIYNKRNRRYNRQTTSRLSVGFVIMIVIIIYIIWNLMLK
jgi:hypothetical protein